VASKQEQLANPNKIIPQKELNLTLRNLDILICMMGQVKLKKENQLSLMQGIKVFISDFKTKKKGYKLLALIVEKYELDQGIGELIQIHKELTPLMEG
jgi:hypothetical protein